MMPLKGSKLYGETSASRAVSIFCDESLLQNSSGKDRKVKGIHRKHLSIPMRQARVQYKFNGSVQRVPYRRSWLQAQVQYKESYTGIAHAMDIESLLHLRSRVCSIVSSSRGPERTVAPSGPRSLQLPVREKERGVGVSMGDERAGA